MTRQSKLEREHGRTSRHICGPLKRGAERGFLTERHTPSLIIMGRNRACMERPNRRSYWRPPGQFRDDV
jgi:hypothetical protein